LKNVTSKKCQTVYIYNIVQLTEYLDTFSEQFDANSERGHGVISFGDAYNYPGAKAAKPISKNIPEPLTELVSLIQAKFPESVINQCLVNRYLDEKSELPKHSDNEASLMFDSNIFTISLGSTCDVLFSKIEGSETKTVSATGKSLYVMSKQSQSVWQHQIDQSPTTREKRYSVTFRYVTSNNENATIIIGDSNTRFLKFGSGKGRFGQRMPGKRVECFTIDMINPSLCEGYRNIFIHCGVNDIKKRSSNIEQCASDLKVKLDDICRKCPYSKVTVSPVLPTKFGWLNEKALYFNKLIFQYVDMNPRVGTLDFNEFVDEDGKLADQFGRFKDKSDAIHLGSTGIFKLSRLIVDKIQRNPIDGRQFSDIARSKVGMFNSRVQRAPKP
jgi:alkylated DNA repair dioxygenase AlkB